MQCPRWILHGSTGLAGQRLLRAESCISACSPHELWTTRLLARHAREYGPGAGYECLARLVQGTVCK
ncbi:MAG: hypothetical protein EOR45_37190, partial [Mesorhizobium sp.]